MKNQARTMGKRREAVEVFNHGGILRHTVGRGAVHVHWHDDQGLKACGIPCTKLSP
jgi:hypothetical protein